jgi:hypothetical protein
VGLRLKPGAILPPAGEKDNQTFPLGDINRPEGMIKFLPAAA